MIQIISNGRQSGKTYKLIQWLKEGHWIEKWPNWSRVIIVDSAGKGRLLKDQYDIRENLILTYEQYKYGINAYDSDDKIDIGIDDVDFVLNQMFTKGSVEIITLVGKGSKEPNLFL